jgi:hypothetical protein
MNRFIPMSSVVVKGYSELVFTNGFKKLKMFLPQLVVVNIISVG